MTFFIAPLENRSVLKITGKDRQDFLQGISTNDVSTVTKETAVYTCFLTPQGKFLFDMFLMAADEDTWLADIEKDSASLLLAHLNKYKLRADVNFQEVADIDLYAIYGGAMPTQLTENANVFHDPRVPSLGWRAFVSKDNFSDFESDALKLAGDVMDFVNYDSFRLSMGVPDGRRDISPEKMHLVEANLEQLSGVSFKKGCFTGQELNARVYNRGLVKKRLLPMQVEQDVSSGDTVTDQSGKKIGTVTSQTGRYALALVKLESAREILAAPYEAQVNGNNVELYKPDWLVI